MSWAFIVTEGVDMVCAAFVKVDRSKKVCRLGSDYGVSMLLHNIVYVHIICPFHTT